MESQARIERHRGKLMRMTSNGLLATFYEPGRVVRCALAHRSSLSIAREGRWSPGEVLVLSIAQTFGRSWWAQLLSTSTARISQVGAFAGGPFIAHLELDQHADCL